MGPGIRHLHGHEVITGAKFNAKFFIQRVAVKTQVLLFILWCLLTLWKHHGGLSDAALQHANSQQGETNGPLPAGLPTQELAGDHPENLRATNPTTGRPPYYFNPVFADKFSQSGTLVLEVVLHHRSCD